MPAVAPQATSRRNCRGGRIRKRPLNEDSIAASCTIGPSRPMEAPDPMENSEDTLRATVWRKPITRARRQWLPCSRPRRLGSQREASCRTRPASAPRPPATAAAARTPGRAPDGPCHAACPLRPAPPVSRKAAREHHGGQRAQQSHQGGCEQGVGRFSATNWPRNAPAQRNFPIRISFAMAGILRRRCSLLFSGPSTERAHGAWNACPRTRLTGLSGGSRGENRMGKAGFSGVKWRSGACPARISLWITTGARCCAHVVEAS